MVTWKRRQTQVDAGEDPGLDPQIAARLERLARESSVPIGASWQEPEADGAEAHVEERVEERVEEPVAALATAAAGPVDAVVALSDEPVMAAPEVPVADTGETIVATEESSGRRPLTMPKGGLVALQAPRAGSAPIEAGSAPSRAVAQPRRTATMVAPQPLTSKPAESKRRSVIPVKGTIPRTPRN